VFIDLTNSYFLVLCTAAVAGSAMLLWVYMDSYQVRQAFRWWSERQFRHQGLESDRIRNGIMQEMFALRRGIELSPKQDVVTQNSMDWLEQVKHLQRSLELLCHQLSPPFIEDSLPLTIQSMSEFWQLELSCTIQVDVPTDWQAEPQDKNHVVLAVLSELLRLSAFYCQGAQPIQIKLTQVDQVAELMVRAETAEALAHSEEWTYLSRCFRYLVGGTGTCQQTPEAITWLLKWRIVKASG
jgi:hypothetical protein